MMISIRAAPSECTNIVLLIMSHIIALWLGCIETLLSKSRNILSATLSSYIWTLSRTG